MQVYTDGCCLVNPGGAGGWASVIVDKHDIVDALVGGDSSTTNNRMELMAVIVSLWHLPKNGETVLYSDSEYVLNPVRYGWLKKWQRNGWKNSAGKPLANIDLWQEFLRLSNLLRISFGPGEEGTRLILRHVQGHSGNRWNEMADSLAYETAQRVANGEEVGIDLLNLQNTI